MLVRPIKRYKCGITSLGLLSAYTFMCAVTIVYLEYNNREKYGSVTQVPLANSTSAQSFSKGIFVQQKSENLGEEVASFLNLSFMRKTPETREMATFKLKPWKIDAERPRSAQLDITNQDSLNIRWSMVIFVKSDSANTLQRRVARWTWASFEYIDGIRIETIFVVGRGKTPKDELGLLQENKQFGDTLQLDITENYKNVGYKTLAGMQWAATHFPPDWIYASSDDDMMPDLLQLQQKIDEMRRFVQNVTNGTDFAINSPIFCGYGYNVLTKPKRDNESKWYFNETTYPLPLYPSYCNGGWYAMSVGLATRLYGMSRHLSYFWIDDVWITGFLRLKYFADTMRTCKFCTAKDKTIGLWRKNPFLLAFSQTGDTDKLMGNWRLLAANIYQKPYIFVNTGDS